MLRIQEAREAHGLTQEQLAELLDTTQQTIQRWEVGAVDPKISKVEKISEILGVTVTYLLGTDREETPEEIELIGLYREMSTQQRTAILAVARAMVV